jgi:hypothetical protein
MRTSIIAAIVVLALSVGAPSGAFAAAQPVKFLPGQVILACPAETAPKQPGIVCSRNVLVSGGQPISGYTFTVRSGTTLPKGVFLVPLTGVITMQSAISALPAAGQSSKIHLSVSDGSKTANGTVTFSVQNRNLCGCPVFTVITGPMPPARAHQPYATTLAVTGPPSNQVLRPTYVWKVRKGSKIPPGLVLDQSRGMLRGTPHASASGKTYNFYVDVMEMHTKQKAISTNFYTLHVY